MIIESGNVAMSSRRSYDRTTTATSSLSLWGSDFMQESTVQITDHYHEESEPGNDNSYNATEHSKDSLFNEFMQAQSLGTSVSITKKLSDLETIRQQSITYLLRMLLGKRNIKFGNLSRHPKEQQMPANRTQTSSPTGGSYTESTYFAEQETTSFSTVGTVKTADGREIQFNLSMTMSRSFQQAYTGTVAFGSAKPKLCDPLVINLNTCSANVTDQKFYFDLDADGTKDTISNLSSGSGFLALDKNNDGIINDGNELFGAQTGDGFADLAAYDEDKNGWIDEADAIFDKLRIWTKDENGKDVLCAIGKAGVGAIYLGSEKTDFSLNSLKDNSTNALVRKTGIFLYENGGCGTVQHLDMALSV